MSTNSFKESAPNFLITSPKKAASIIFGLVRAMKNQKRNYIINLFGE